jgi:hypothetical protein
MSVGGEVQSQHYSTFHRRWRPVSEVSELAREVVVEDWGAGAAPGDEEVTERRVVGEAVGVARLTAAELATLREAIAATGRRELPDPVVAPT